MLPLCLREKKTEDAEDKSQRPLHRHQRWVGGGRGAPVSPVLHLQQVADKAVPSTALNKIPLSRQEVLGGGSTVLLQEVVEQRQLTLLLHLMQRHSVHHRLNHPAV